VHAEDRESVQKSLDEYLDPAGPAHFQSDYRIVTWNGTGIRHVLAQGQMFFEGEGENRQRVRAVGTLQDVTALKQGEQALRRVNHELEQFAYAAAHDLQEPLRNVGLATQILASRYEGKFDNEADGLLKIAVSEPVRMQAMVKDLLAYARALTSEEGSNATADANAVLPVILTSLVLAIQEKQAQITWETLPHVHMSELHLTQILQNLIGNSLKYANTTEPRIHVSGFRRSGECVLSVKDNGPGIAPEYHQRAFGVFKRLHSKDVPGTGIGLALCKRIVEHYGGRIWIDSAAGEGMTVHFTVPA
jgi:light-regulated signal transduction histidine kinase (bacteriophytochrome)